MTVSYQVRTFTLFLRRSVKRLPAVVALGQVGPAEPALVPDVEVPGDSKQSWLM